MADAAMILAVLDMTYGQSLASVTAIALAIVLWLAVIVLGVFYVGEEMDHDWRLLAGAICALLAAIPPTATWIYAAQHWWG